MIRIYQGIAFAFGALKRQHDSPERPDQDGSQNGGGNHICPRKLWATSPVPVQTPRHVLYHTSATVEAKSEANISPWSTTRAIHPALFILWRHAAGRIGDGCHSFGADTELFCRRVQVFQ